jgi:osmotically-inducible protein OsmY
MTFLDRLITPARDAGSLTRQRASLAAHGSDGGPGWAGTALVGLAAAGAGAAAAMLLDPARGRARRARFADQSSATIRRIGRRGEQLARRARSEVEGRLQALRAPSNATPRLDDGTVTDRVLSEVFRDPGVPKGTVNVNVERGVVVLRGEVVDDALRHRIVDRVERVDGVWSVRDLLHLPGQAAPTREDLASTRS